MKITIDCIWIIAFWSIGGPGGRKFCDFPIDVEFIGTIDVGEFGSKNLLGFISMVSSLFE